MNTTVLSYSELDTYRQCPLKHQWSYVERWRKPTKADGALAKGSLYHLVMERHYEILKRYPDRTDESVVAQINAELDEAIRPLLFDMKTGDQTETQALIEWMYDGYVAQWGYDLDWEIVAVEQAFELPLVGPDDVPDENRRLKGKIDLVVRDRQTGHLWVVDHKTGANLPNEMDLEIDDQFGLYSWAMRQSGTSVLGAIHNSIRTTRNVADFPDYAGKLSPQTLDQRHRRTFLNRSDRELTALAVDAWAVARNAYPEPGQTRPLYSSPDPRNCGWKCDFKEIHLLARKGKDPQFALTEAGFAQDFTRH